MTIGKPIEPASVVQTVERYVDAELADVNKYENRSLLDESGIYSLHLLAADIYQAVEDAGFSAR